MVINTSDPTLPVLVSDEGLTKSSPPSSSKPDRRASLAGRPFRLNPQSIQWNFETKVADVDTVGGKVIQIFGTAISDLTVEGTFGKGGWREQKDFLVRMKDMAEKMIDRPKANPPHFKYPARGWDMLVYLKEYSSPDGEQAVVLDSTIFAPKWTLTLHVVEDNSGLKKIAHDSYLARIAKGIGWKQTAFNGPMGVLEMQDAIGGVTPEEYILDNFGIGSVPTGNQDPGSGHQASTTDTTLPGGNVGGSGGTPAQNKALGRAMAERGYGWTGPQWDDLLLLWNRESGWSTTADNAGSSAYGIPQAMVSAHFPLPAGFYDSFTGSEHDGTFHGSGGDPVVQIRWGLNYIKNVYGSPVAAWAHSQSVGWY